VLIPPIFNIFGGLFDEVNFRLVLRHNLCVYFSVLFWGV